LGELVAKVRVEDPAPPYQWAPLILALLNIGTKLAQILDLFRRDPPTLRYIPDPRNVFWA
jgi:hypothetical protein